MASRMAQSRRTLAAALGSDKAIRAMRLSAGLSQSKLAALAGTTQNYVARVEAGTLDPGTDMISRLAGALSVDEGVVFAAVRAQRKSRGACGVG